jgi:DNA-binding transcriptional LysR family regulator
LKLRLINRTARTVSLTEAGARYLEGCRTLLEELDHLETTVTHTECEISGILRVVASSAISPVSLTHLVGGFRKLYPGLTVRLTLTERHVDLIENGYDVGILAAFADGPSLIERPVGADALVPVATPAFISDCGLPLAPQDLESLPLIGLRDERFKAILRFRHDGGAIDQLRLEPVFSVNDGSMVRLATLNNMGFSILPKAIVQEYLKGGALVRLLPDYSVDAPSMNVSIVYPARQNLPRNTRAFVDYASDRLTKEFSGTFLLLDTTPAARSRAPREQPCSPV